MAYKIFQCIIKDLFSMLVEYIHIYVEKYIIGNNE